MAIWVNKSAILMVDRPNFKESIVFCLPSWDKEIAINKIKTKTLLSNAKIS